MKVKPEDSTKVPQAATIEDIAKKKIEVNTSPVRFHDRQQTTTTQYLPPTLWRLPIRSRWVSRRRRRLATSTPSRFLNDLLLELNRFLAYDSFLMFYQHLNRSGFR
jgi:hypothetical protein